MKLRRSAVCQFWSIQWPSRHGIGNLSKQLPQPERIEPWQIPCFCNLNVDDTVVNMWSLLQPPYNSILFLALLPTSLHHRQPRRKTSSEVDTRELRHLMRVHVHVGRQATSANCPVSAKEINCTFQRKCLLKKHFSMHRNSAAFSPQKLWRNSTTHTPCIWIHVLRHMHRHALV